MQDLLQGTYKGCAWKVAKSWGFISTRVQVPKLLQKRRREVENLPFLKHRFYITDKDYSQKDPKKFELWIKFNTHTYGYENSLEAGKDECKKLIDALIELKEKIKKEEMEQLAKKLKSKG